MSNSKPKRRSRNGKFVTVREVNEWEGATWQWYIRKAKNMPELRAFKKWIDEYYGEDNGNRDNGGFDVDFYGITERDVDVLVENTDSNYFDLHNKLDGKFEWKKPIERHVLNSARKEIFQKIMANCWENPSKNRDYFEPSDKPAEKYIIFARWDRYDTKKPMIRTAVQYTGNEEEIENFRRDHNVNLQYYLNFSMDKIVDKPQEKDVVIDGKFVYTKFVDNLLNRKRDDYIFQELYKGGIRCFVD